MTAPVIANNGIVIAEMLINPTTGLPYKAGSADTPDSVMLIGDPTVPLACVLIDPTTGNPYRT